jgi:hypothetical protein
VSEVSIKDGRGRKSGAKEDCGEYQYLQKRKKQTSQISFPCIFNSFRKTSRQTPPQEGEYQFCIFPSKNRSAYRLFKHVPVSRRKKETNTISRSTFKRKKMKLLKKKLHEKK